jgi:predicted ester cyclase
MSTETTMKNKALVWEFQQKLSSADAMTVPEIVKGYLHEDIVWNGPHPINQLKGSGAVIQNFWKPFLEAFPDFERNNDIFLGGAFKGDEWVSSMGHYVATFTNDWLGIPANGQVVTLRFGEFCRVHNGQIREMYVLIDLLDVMRQVNLWPIPKGNGLEAWWPKPSTYNGLIVKSQDVQESRFTKKLVTNWINEQKQFEGTVANIDQLPHSKFFHPKSMMYCSSGFGVNRGIDGLKKYFQEPYMRAFGDRKLGYHEANVVEGRYMAASGWNSMKARHIGEFLGIDATQNLVKIRVMEWWRRSGNFIKETWMMIDMVDLMMQLGVDEFAKMHDAQEKDQWL